MKVPSEIAVQHWFYQSHQFYWRGHINSCEAAKCTYKNWRHCGQGKCLIRTCHQGYFKKAAQLKEIVDGTKST